MSGFNNYVQLYVARTTHKNGLRSAHMIKFAITVWIKIDLSSLHESHFPWTITGNAVLSPIRTQFPFSECTVARDNPPLQLILENVDFLEMRILSV